MNIERLRSLLSYDPETGAFRWLVQQSNMVKVGDIAGSTSGHRYRRIRLDRRTYRAHRLAWLYVHGKWPQGGLDHINGDPLDNRISNLRLATQSQNAANSRRYRTNSSGLKGVSREPRTSKWRATIRARKQTTYLGCFDTPEQAHEAYMAAAVELFGEFARPS